MKTMKIEVGKTYFLRCGDIAKIVRTYNLDGVDFYVGHHPKYTENPHTMEWYSGGNYLIQATPHAFDIVSEYNNTETVMALHKEQLDSKGFGELVWSHRLHMKISVRELAAQVGTSAATISRVENGKKPDIDTYLSLCSWMRHIKTLQNET